MADVPELSGILQTAVTSILVVHVDIAAVTFIDSTVISALITARQTATAAGHRFAIVAPTGHVRRVLDTAGILDTLLDDTAT